MKHPAAPRLLGLILLAAFVATACSSSDGSSTSADVAQTSTESAVSETTEQVSPDTTASPDTAASPDTTESPDTAVASSPVTALPPAPAVAEGELGAAAVDAVDALVANGAAAIAEGEPLDLKLVEAVGATRDARLTWIVTDLLRYFQDGPELDALLAATEQLTGVRFAADQAWVRVSDAMIAWDTPAPTGYQQWKSALLVAIEPKWAPSLADEAATVDWRYVSWGGVLLDDRFLGDIEGCAGCIASMDFPPSVPAEEAWIDDDEIVFGVVVDGEARAFARNIMEVHELANDTLGGRNFALAYCTLCGSAEAYYTDVEPGLPGAPLVLHTSGLLQRSNKIIWEFRTASLIDTFTGEALTGPLREQGLTLEAFSVVTTTWGEWLAEYPTTSLNDGAGGGGRQYPRDPLGDRDANGPTFPVGQVDDRLGPQVQVVGAVGTAGPVAFPVPAARAALDNGETVELGGLRVERSAGGLIIIDSAGAELPTNQSRWFAWSQFNPGTELWTAP